MVSEGESQDETDRSREKVSGYKLNKELSLTSSEEENVGPLNGQNSK